MQIILSLFNMSDGKENKFKKRIEEIKNISKNKEILSDAIEKKSDAIEKKSDAIEKKIDNLKKEIDNYENLPEYEKLKKSDLIENKILSLSFTLNNMKNKLENPYEESIDDNSQISDDFNSLDAISSESEEKIKHEESLMEEKFMEDMEEINKIKYQLSKDISLEESLNYYISLSKLSKNIKEYLENKKMNVTYLDD